MGALLVTSAAEGSLYIDGSPMYLQKDTLARAEMPPRAHLLFMPYEAGYLPVARRVSLREDGTPRGTAGLRAVLWPGGALEIRLCPERVAYPHTVGSSPFAGGMAALRLGSDAFLDIGGWTVKVGSGPGCGLKPLSGGWLAAFAQVEGGEALRVVAPGRSGPEVKLSVEGRQVLLSQDGARVRVQEFVPEGARHQAVREFRREGNAYAQRGLDITPTRVPPATGMEAARAFAAAVRLGVTADALAMLTPQLRALVDEKTLGRFLGDFDGYTDARHIEPPVEGDVLALLRPAGDVHIAKLMVFEVIKTKEGLKIDNIKALE